MPEAESPVLYGKYQLISRLAVGGMAEVFKAKSHGVEGFEKILVIKRILPELSENARFVDMFIAEAKIAVTLSHANIVQVFDLGRAEDRYFIAMEYVAGNDLANLLRRGRQLKRPISQELAVFVVSEIAKGLDYAHRRRDSSMRPLGIVHRDVSPQNVLVSWEGEVKLTDFGIAKALGTVEEEGVVKGKYAYMSPEQARGENVDGRADLFALGVILYESLSGVSPFDSDSAYESLRRLRTGDIKRLVELVPDVPEELAAIVEKAMASSPADRHPNAGRLYEDLVQFLYSSGRRVSGQDLSRYATELKSAREATASSGEDARLLAVFDAEADASRARTPVEIPRSVRPGEIGRPGKRTATGVRPAVERRDATLVAVAASGPVAAREGAVEKLAARHGGVMLGGAAGSGVAVIFGVRDPDGRDSETAARFALRLLRAMDGSRATSGTSSSRVFLRIGIDVGRVQVGLDGEPVADQSLEDLRSRTLKLAERAAGAQVLVSPAAQRAISSSFSTLPMGDEPGAAHHLVEELAASSGSGKLVGRRDELKLVGELLAISNRGRLKVVGLTGEAGIGKTRLVLETRRRLRLGGHDVGFHVAACSRQARGVPLSAMAELVRAILALDEHDSEDTVRDRVVRLRELGLAPQEIGAVAALLGAVGDGAEPSAPLLRPAITRIVARLATDRLTVLCLDGAESMDDESQAIVDGIVRELRSARVAILLAFRPGFVHAWQADAAYQEIALKPMGDDDVARLAAMRLSAEEVPAELLRDLTQKSGGNPLFVEEFLKALGEAGALEVADGRVTYRQDVAAVEVPKTLRGMITSRLARLGPLDRHLLQIAAIAGGRTGAEVVAAVTDEAPSIIADALRALEARQLIVRQGTSSDFALTSDVAADVLRDGLTLESRRQHHAALANALEALYPQKLDELAERLANHWREAGERQKAIEYLVKAGERLAIEQAPIAAATSFERAVVLLGQMAVPDRERMLTLYLRIGEVCWKARKVQGDKHMEAAIELAESLGRRDYLARFSLLHGRFLVVLHRVDEGQRWLERANELARVLDDKALSRDVLLGIAESIVKVGMHRQAIQSLRQALALAEETRDLQSQMRCLTNLALTHATGGEPETGLGYVERARGLLLQQPDRFTEVELYKMEALVCFFGKRWQAGIEAARRGLELAKEYDFPYEAAVNAHNMGECYVRTGDYKAAFASFRYSYEMSRDHGIEHLEDINLRMLGFIDAFRFGSSEGRAHVEESMRKAEERGNVWDNVQSRYLLAMIQQQAGEIADAETTLREALRVASENGYASYVTECEEGLRALRAGEPIQRQG